MNRRDGHFLRATIIWVVLSALGIGIVLVLSPNMAGWGLLPPVASDRTDEVDQVLRLFTLLSVPVFCLVIVYAGYSVFAFRSRSGGRPTAAGPVVRGNMPLQVGWVVASFVLVAFLYVYGLYFLGQVSAAPQGDVLQVNVTGEQWLWDYSYPQYNISGTTLELPVGRPVEFTIRSIDVQHSFWIPSFAVKQDAVPGEITHAAATPTVIGDYVVRCAELCGLYHAYMNTPVHVVSASDFDAWVASQQATPSASTARPSGFPVAATGDLVARRSSAWLEG
jgi:cytochrome c oxidase subunit 2